MHITLLTEGIHPIALGGMQKHSYNLAKYFAQQQVYVDVYYYQKKGSNIHLTQHFDTPNERKYLNFIAVDYPTSAALPLHYFYDVYQYSKNIYAHLQKKLHHTDFIYIQGFAGWHTLNQLKKNKNTQNLPKTGVHFHGYEGYQAAADTKSYWKEQAVLPFLKHNVCHSDYIFSLGKNITNIIQNKLHIDPYKILQIPIGIDAKNINNIIEKPINNPRKFVFIGRYSRRKGIEELTQTVQKLLLNNIKFDLTLVGDIPQPMQINAPNIHYTGAINDEKQIFDLLHHADVLICPSYAEGMPTVILEAMAHKCAILATDVGAINEIVNDHTGWLIPHGNQQILEQKMIEILNLDAETLMQKQISAQNLVLKSYTWQAVINQTIEKLHDVLHQK